MIIIKNLISLPVGSNVFRVTTQEKVIGTPTYYLIKLINKLNKDEVIFVPNYDGKDMSTNPKRYNDFWFRFVDPSLSSNLTGDLIELEIGQYNYEIYSEYGSIPTIEPILISGNLVESGIAIVK